MRVVLGVDAFLDDRLANASKRQQLVKSERLGTRKGCLYPSRETEQATARQQKQITTATACQSDTLICQPVPVLLKDVVFGR